jgi:hypothetical protein
MAALLKETEVAGERFMTMGATLLVASKSKLGEWYRIENAECTCPGFTYRNVCRHVVAAAKIEKETDTVTVEITSECGGGWVVIWYGTQHGGVHSRREDAEGHADELRQAPAWDRQQWMERHSYEAPLPPVPTGHPALTLLQGAAR